MAPLFAANPRQVFNLAAVCASIGCHSPHFRPNPPLFGDAELALLIVQLYTRLVNGLGRLHDQLAQFAVRRAVEKLYFLFTHHQAQTLVDLGQIRKSG
jgi:hypothetical protein